MSNIAINHGTYVEIPNGVLFVEKVLYGKGDGDSEDFTFRQGGLEIIYKERGVLKQTNLKSRRVGITNSITRETLKNAVTHVSGRNEDANGLRTLQEEVLRQSREFERLGRELVERPENLRIQNERIWTNYEEWINHFDRISQQQ